MICLPKFAGYYLSVLFLFLSLSGLSSDQEHAAQDTLSHEDVVRGERLFHGLANPENKTMNCSECHTTYSASFVDTVNWNPDALEISLKYFDRSADDLGRVLLSPSGAKMAESHKNFNFNPQDIAQIKGFMDRFPERGLSEQKPEITNLLLFIFASILFLTSITDLVITKKLKRKWIHLAVLTGSSVYITWVLVINAIAIGRSPGYSPDQPIKFSHSIHAGQNKTECVYCHSYAPQSKVSGITPSNVCMNCHLVVRNGTRSGMFEIAKVISSFENSEPISWVQVHNLPDHVYYNHSQHVTAGGLDCRECHGPVENMDRIYQVSDLSMGWCVNCHRDRKVNFDENEFYSQYTILSEKVSEGILDSVMVDTQGGNDCMRCHY